VSRKDELGVLIDQGPQDWQILQRGATDTASVRHPARSRHGTSRHPGQPRYFRRVRHGHDGELHQRAHRRLDRRAPAAWQHLPTRRQLSSTVMTAKTFVPRPAPSSTNRRHNPYYISSDGFAVLGATEQRWKGTGQWVAVDYRAISSPVCSERWMASQMRTSARPSRPSVGGGAPVRTQWRR